MHEHFANYQIGVDIFRGLPKGCCEVTVRLNDELARIQGWRKKVFVCQSKKFLNGKLMRPIHATDVDVVVYEWNHPEKKNLEIHLNNLKIKLFKISELNRLI